MSINICNEVRGAYESHFGGICHVHDLGVDEVSQSAQLELRFQYPESGPAHFRNQREGASLRLVSTVVAADIRSFIIQSHFRGGHHPIHWSGEEIIPENYPLRFTKQFEFLEPFIKAKCSTGIKAELNAMWLGAENELRIGLGGNLEVGVEIDSLSSGGVQIRRTFRAISLPEIFIRPRPTFEYMTWKDADT